ncbi:AraC family transcriptional regulator [Lysinibacillus fusiformis]|uniref:AraC family transcriptional regulator n=2 Tax=Bacillaceae TaxID=186817 RepID=UPI0023304C3C|nr:AraC family transcriptional regulator [Lysinibacillus sp. OF-1]MEE3809573.1 AraC family transcriptional regulator [Lysinibacillus fusiformis]WCH49689.1 AraC family transcriptional regulator [Lysinibacillus sp. OF-1]
MNISEEIQLWNQVVIRVLDIRVKRLGRGDEIRNYVTPASTFMFVANGRAELWVNDEVWLSERFHLIHIGKGQRITVQSTDFLDIYMILYNASLPASALREFHMMMQTDNPFMKSWAVSPSEPLVMLERLETMLSDWQQIDNGQIDKEKDMKDVHELRRLKAKGEFIRFVHAALQERMELAHAPTLAEQVVRYIARNYRGMISMEQLAHQMNYTPQYVSRKFKEQMGCSPLDYTIRLRIDLARNLLCDTEATLQEIAAYVGYPDTVYFNRMFKKQTGITPGEYRRQYQFVGSKDTMNWTDLSIVAPHPAMYHLNGNDIHYQLMLDGGNDMAMSKKNMLAMTLLCLTMVTSACGTSSEGTKGTSGAAKSDQLNAEAPANIEMRTIKTALGDVEVPAHPQRVAASAFLGTVLALDVQPVASDFLLMESPYLEGMLDGVTNVGDSLEALVDLKPDLIITNINKEETVDKYSLIAPTVAMPYNSFESIQEEMRYFGDLLDKKDVAEQWITDFESRTSKLHDEVQAVLDEGETVSIMQEYDGKVFLFGPKSGRGGRIMYEILGANPPATIPEHMLAESFYEFSLELLPEYTGDYLVLTTESTLEELQADPIWGNLPAIRDGKVFLWTESQSWFRDPIAVEGQIDNLANWILEAAKTK